MQPLTALEREAYAKLQQRTVLIVGQRVPKDLARLRNLNQPDVFLSVAEGLVRRGLAVITRPDKRGPKVITLARSV